MEKSDKAINIFLEFVGGGSILSMLKIYGAFTESLINAYIR